MANVTRDSGAGIDARSAFNSGPFSGDLIAGEDLPNVCPCYVKQSDGLVYKSNGTALNEAARVDGITPCAYKAGEAVTLYGAEVRFSVMGIGSTPPVGGYLYVSATAGEWSDTATTGDPNGTVRILPNGQCKLIRVGK